MVKPRERVFNNINPNNRLKLNKYHQEVSKKHVAQSKQLKKKERDIQRLISHDKVGADFKEVKTEELKKVREEIETQKKGFERRKRKEFFMEIKYSEVRLVEQKKLARMLKKVKASLEQNPTDQQLKREQEDILKKMRYVNHFPKTVKYISLFPKNGLEEEGLKFQQKIMTDIEQRHEKDQKFKNMYQEESERKGTDRKMEKDQFFLMQNQ